MKGWGRELRVSRTILWMGLGALGSFLASPSAAQYRHTVDDEMIRSVMPIADSFSVKAGLPPVYTGYRTGTEGSPPSLVNCTRIHANVYSS